MGGRGNGGARNASNTMEFQGRIFTKTDYFKLVDGKMHRNVAAGLIPENRRPYRRAGNYDIYVDSFPTAALPYSNYYIANRLTGDVYRTEVIQGVSDNKQYLKDLVDELKRRK